MAKKLLTIKDEDKISLFNIVEILKIIVDELKIEVDDTKIKSGIKKFFK